MFLICLQLLLYRLQIIWLNKTLLIYSCFTCWIILRFVYIRFFLKHILSILLYLPIRLYMRCVSVPKAIKKIRKKIIKKKNFELKYCMVLILTYRQRPIRFLNYYHFSKSINYIYLIEFTSVT